MTGVEFECDNYAMPLMAEILAMTDNAGVPLVETDEAVIAPLVRQAMELGVDIIKADPTEPSSEFARIVEAAAGVLVIASVGIKAPDDVVIARTAALLPAGASGIAYGRNVLWAEHPVEMTRALCAVVHARATVEEAVRMAKSE